MRYLYAIHHRPTGRFLPHPPSGRRGGSWVEPVCPTKALPRFFRREQDAKGFLTTWLKGPQTNVGHTDWESGSVEYIPEPRLDRAQEPRIRDEWEIVKIAWQISA